MSLVVAIPVRFATIRMHVDKGRRWNVVEHLLLHLLSSTSQSASALVGATNLPWRLIVEVMTRLMRVGWVEIISSKEGITFQITSGGKGVVSNDVLPAVTRPFSRQASFAVDGISGTIFRAKELIPRSKSYLETLRKSTQIIELPVEKNSNKINLDEVIATLLDEDEHCRGIEPLASRYLDLFCLVTVTDENIEGLSSFAPQMLKDRILAAAKIGAIEKSTENAPIKKIDNPSISPTLYDIAFDYRHLIVGGNQHREALIKILKNAVSWVVIHSTFIYATRFKELLPLMYDAAKRGVRIDILWGKSSSSDGANSVAEEVEKCRGLLDDDAVVERIRLHKFTTDSHAKLLFADDGKGQMIAVLGSCNWLSASFNSFDVSIFFTDPKIVGEIAAKIANMATGPGGHWSELVIDLSTHAANLKSHKENHSVVTNASASLILGSEHNLFMQMARDMAKHRIVVASHRISKNADTLAFVPLTAALKVKNVSVELYYNQFSVQSDDVLVQGMLQAGVTAGMSIQKLSEPQMHAKFLMWDDDNIVVTSQNWLSADPMENSCAEIGIFISSKGIANILIKQIRDTFGGQLSN